MRANRKVLTATLALAGALGLGITAQAQAQAQAQAAVAAPPHAAASAVVPNSGWDQHAIVAKNGGYMNVFGYGGSGAEVGLWYTSQPTANEVFFFEPAGTNTYRLHPKYNPGLCLDTPHSNYSNGVYIQAYTCNGTGAQTFKLFIDQQTGDHVIAADWNGGTPTKCLDVHTNNQGTRVWLWSCNGTGQQDWYWG